MKSVTPDGALAPYDRRSTYAVGDRFVHPEHGECEVVRVDPAGTCCTAHSAVDLHLLGMARPESRLPDSDRDDRKRRRVRRAKRDGRPPTPEELADAMEPSKRTLQRREREDRGRPLTREERAARVSAGWRARTARESPLVASPAADIAGMRAAGRTIEEIARHYNTTRTSVYRAINRSAPPAEKLRRTNPGSEERDRKIIELRVGGATQEEIAERIGCSVSTISRVLGMRAPGRR